LVLIVGAVLFLAYTNGANDNFKGFATLFGSGGTYRTALAWATLTTLAGSLLALYLVGGLVKAFSGSGLVPDAVTHQPAFLLAVSIGAALTILLAWVTTLPLGAGLAALAYLLLRVIGFGA
jgi:PiT family inorganic phosphate transporter